MPLPHRLHVATGGSACQDHAAFARFRTGRCTEAAEKLFYQYVKLLEEQEETNHETVFVDGTKMESRAGRYTFLWRKIIEKQLAIMGNSRNSYSTTDHDATFIHMKEDHMHVCCPNPC